jgi:hypothetical protein
MTTDTEYEAAARAHGGDWRQAWVITLPDALADAPADELAQVIAAAVADAVVVTTGDDTLTVRLDVPGAAGDALTDLTAGLEDED